MKKLSLIIVYALLISTLVGCGKKAPVETAEIIPEVVSSSSEEVSVSSEGISSAPVSSEIISSSKEAAVSSNSSEVESKANISISLPNTEPNPEPKPELKVEPPIKRVEENKDKPKEETIPTPPSFITNPSDADTIYTVAELAEVVYYNPEFLHYSFVLLINNIETELYAVGDTLIFDATNLFDTGITNEKLKKILDEQFRSHDSDFINRLNRARKAAPSLISITYRTLDKDGSLIHSIVYK